MWGVYKRKSLIRGTGIHHLHQLFEGFDLVLGQAGDIEGFLGRLLLDAEEKISGAFVEGGQLHHIF